MSSARHKAVVEHALRRRLARITAPALAATVVTGTVVAVSLGTSQADTGPIAASGQISRNMDPAAIAERLADRSQSVSRSARRVTLVERPQAVRFATAPLNVRTEPADDAKVVDVIPVGAKVDITGENRNGFAEVVRDRKAYWVTAEYLGKDKPETDAASSDESSSTAPAAGNCTAAAPSGVVPQAMVVFHEVCSHFPSITTYGGWRGDGEHIDGHAIDVMVSGDMGWQVANYLRANAARLNLYDVIFSQRIFTQERAGEGWRFMPDRGSTTANHYDHVHVAVY
ncbi:MAG: SH3 domain-containing protein [Nocardioides sp.]